LFATAEHFEGIQQCRKEDWKNCTSRANWIERNCRRGSG
jgi:hypothetical protein